MMQDKSTAPPQDQEAVMQDPPSYHGHYVDAKVSGLFPQGNSSEPCSPSSLQRPVKNKSIIGRLWDTISLSRQRARNTTMQHVRRLMCDPHATPLQWTNVLDSCEIACAHSSLFLSCVLQEHFMEDHTPLYWAIVKLNDEEGPSTQDTHLLHILMKYAAPLTALTISDMYWACIVTSNQPLFQRLRNLPDFMPPMSGTDRLLLGPVVPRDEVTVVDIPGVNGSFRAIMDVAQFQKRMRVSKKIILEFIARGRMWQLMFFISSKDIGRRVSGSWCISLCLVNHSPPTYIDAKLVINECKPRNPTITSARSDYKSTMVKSSIVIPCRASCQLYPTTSTKHNAVIMSLDDSPIGTSIQYNGNTFIAPDGTLKLCLDARLRKPPDDNRRHNEECVIA